MQMNTEKLIADLREIYRWLNSNMDTQQGLLIFSRFTIKWHPGEVKYYAIFRMLIINRDEARWDYVKENLLYEFERLLERHNFQKP